MFEKIKVSEWMTSPVISIQPNTLISDAHQLMKEKNIRRLPVIDHEHLVGMVTIGDVREASPSDATYIEYLGTQLPVGTIDC
jgi:acetoin utilization protein AcuB